MSHWTTLCSLADAPPEGSVTELDAAGTPVCLARLHGELHALNNICPHRQGPLAEGWIEGNAVLCPWHSWAFDLRTGIAEPPEHAAVPVYPVRVEDGHILIDLQPAPGSLAASPEPK